MENKNKDIPLIVAGSGPSLATIDYNRVPENVKIARANMFFFEETYYLGKKVDFSLFQPAKFNVIYYTIMEIIKRKEYFIENMYSFENFGMLDPARPSYILRFPYLNDAMPLFRQNKELYHRMFMNYNYHGTLFNTGVLLLFMMYELGFRQFYLVGYDLYSKDKDAYLWEKRRENSPYKLGICSPEQLAEIKKTGKPLYHDSKAQLEALELFKSLPDIQIYSISEDSAINEYFPLAPILDKANNVLVDKASDTILDFLPLPENLEDPNKTLARLKREGY